MNIEYLIEKIEVYCPHCGSVHLLEKVKRESMGLFKGEIVDYEETFYRCPVTHEEDNEFVPAALMDENLLSIRDGYRKAMGLLASYEIAEIRAYYGATQSEFSNLLGWGDVTVTRYESKTIQDETYDNLMRMAHENPLFALQSLERHKIKFTEEKYQKVRRKVVQRIEESGLQYLKIQEIKSIYVNYQEESAYNGYKILNLEKLAIVMGYFASSVNNLYKVKLMYLLWYADALHFKLHGKSMTGLVYRHSNYGALPLAYDEIIFLPTVRVEEVVCHDDISYRILPRTKVKLSSFTLDELNILEVISHKFKDYHSKEIVSYMHEEKAYTETEPFDMISFDLAKELHELT